MTSFSEGAGFDDLDDPSPPAPASTHRAEVTRRIRRIRHRRQLMAGGLAMAIVFGATFTAVNLRAPAPVNKALSAPSGASNQMFWPTTGSPGPGSPPPALSPWGPSIPTQSDATAAAGAAGTGSGSGAAGTGPGAAGANAGAAAPSQLFSPATTVTPCPDPAWIGGQYCGPAPEPGNGSGPGGRCSGQETTPPCGRGVVIGNSYAYTFAVRCDGRITFDGRQWESDILPPANGPDLWVWMRLAPGGHLRFVSTDGTLGFTPVQGHATPHCGGTPSSGPQP